MIETFYLLEINAETQVNHYIFWQCTDFNEFPLKIIKNTVVVFIRTNCVNGLTLSSTAQVICDLAFLNAYSSKIS